MASEPIVLIQDVKMRWLCLIAAKRLANYAN